MILPQSDAFMLLKQRLDCVPNYYNKVAESGAVKKAYLGHGGLEGKVENAIDFKELLTHFIEVQKKHKFFKKNSRLMMS